MVALSFSSGLLAAGYVAAAAIGVPSRADDDAPVPFSLPLKRHLQSRADGLDVVNNIKKNFHAVLEVGTPPQMLDAMLDLGSSYTVVQSDLLPPDMQGSSPLYRPSQSSSAKKWDGHDWGISYVGLSQEGPIYNDTVTLGGMTLNDFSIQVVSKQTEGTPVEGHSVILGIADKLTSTGDVPNFLGAAFKKAGKQFFTMWFDWANDLGSIGFGQLDDSKYTGDIVYVPIQNEGSNTFWRVQISGIGAADPVTHQLLHSNMEPFTAILDTGATTSYLLNNSLEGYHGGIPDAYFQPYLQHCWDYPCDLNETLPNLVLFVDNKPIIVERHSYGYAQQMGIREGRQYNNRRQCRGSMRGDWFHSQGPMIGADILAGIHLLFDHEKHQVGFANSSAMKNNGDYRVPRAWAPDCTYQDPKLIDTPVKPVIKACTEANFGGSCSEIAVKAPGCFVLDPNITVASVQPVQGSNIRCSLHSDDVCRSRIADATDFTSANGVKTVGTAPKAIACVSEGVLPRSEDGAGVTHCGTGNDIVSNCSLHGANPFQCNQINGLPEERNWVIDNTIQREGHGRTGTCFYFKDSKCTNWVYTLDMCNSDTRRDFGYPPEKQQSYVGSVMCV